LFRIIPGGGVTRGPTPHDLRRPILGFNNRRETQHTQRGARAPAQRTRNLGHGGGPGIPGGGGGGGTFTRGVVMKRFRPGPHPRAPGGPARCRVGGIFQPGGGGRGSPGPGKHFPQNRGLGLAPGGGTGVTFPGASSPKAFVATPKKADPVCKTRRGAGGAAFFAKGGGRPKGWGAGGEPENGIFLFRGGPGGRGREAKRIPDWRWGHITLSGSQVGRGHGGGDNHP